MTTHDNDDDLQALWQQPQDINVQELINQVATERKKTLRILLLDIIGNLSGLVLVFYLYTIGLFGQQVWVLYAFTILTIAYLWWVITWRRGLWEVAGHSVIDLLKRKRKHAELDIKVARTFSWGLPIGCVTGALLVSFIDVEPSIELPRYLASGILVILLSAFGGLFIWGILKERSAKREITRIDALLQELSDRTEDE